MPTEYQFPSPNIHNYFRALVSEDDKFLLLEAVASVAQDEYHSLDINQVLADVDELMARLRRRVSDDAEPLQRLRALNQFFFRDLGFGGNVNDYNDPDNSYLNVVLRTRRGIPVSLAVLWLELAQGLGLNARGVGLPGHFMVKVNLPNGQVVIDPFTGQSLSREELAERIEPFRRHAGLAGDADVPMGLYLEPATPRDILARVLRNLKEIHLSQKRWVRLVNLLNRSLILQPEGWEDHRDRGLAWIEVGNPQDAVTDLETYLLHVPDALDREHIAAQLSELRRELN